MAGSVNMPGVLAIGDLPTTTSVRLGRGGALVVDNTGTGAAGQVSIAGALSAASLDFGSSPVTCSTLSAGSVAIGSGGVVDCDVGSASAPALYFGPAPSTGLYRAAAVTGVASGGVELLRAGSTVSVFAPLDATGSAFSCGAMTCGALSCASLASAGAVTQPRYSLRVTKNGNQTVTSGAVTALIWDVAEVVGGGATNWPFTPGSTLLTCPKDGKYLFALDVAIFFNDLMGVAWVEINPPGGVPGSSRRYGEASLISSSGGSNWVSGGSFTYQLSANDTILAAVFQTSGSVRNVGISGHAQTAFSITRLSE
ncbi:MAG TPA: hypothetical protein VNI01_05175 [Elusimicrobiota bacterium]|nr:hypothetical protein [Elusimicrobiota bacterium]